VYLITPSTSRGILFCKQETGRTLFLKGMVLILTGLYAIVTDQTRIVVGSSSCFISNMDQAKENCRRGLKKIAA
jgi:hypothetical protein